MIDLETILATYRMSYDKTDADDRPPYKLNRLFGLHDLIIENLNSETVMCEIGSYEGASSSLFAYYCKHVYCVDPWIINWEVKTGTEKTFDERISNFTNITKIKSYSISASEKFENNFFDFVYVDGDHSYNGCKQDMVHWISKIKNGGAIGGHDYWYGGVRDAVNEFFKKYEIKIYSDSSWYVKL